MPLVLVQPPMWSLLAVNLFAWVMYFLYSRKGKKHQARCEDCGHGRRIEADPVLAQSDKLSESDFGTTSTESQPPSHFFALPLHLDQNLRHKIEEFRRKLLQDPNKPVRGLDPTIFVDPAQLHVAVALLTLEPTPTPASVDDEKYACIQKTPESALALVQSLQPEIAAILGIESRLRVPLDELDVIDADESKEKMGHKLHVRSSEEAMASENGRQLKSVFDLVCGRLKESGFVTESIFTSTPKIHCTLLNTKHRRLRGPRQPFSYVDILDSSASSVLNMQKFEQQPEQSTARRIDLGVVEVGEIQLLKIGKYNTESGFLNCGTVSLSPKLNDAASPSLAMPSLVVPNPVRPRRTALLPSQIQAVPSREVTETRALFTDVPRLSKVSDSDPIYSTFQQKFSRSWIDAGAPAPDIKAIFQVTEPQALRTGYESYRDQIESRGHFADRLNKAGQEMLAGNEKRLFYGAKRACLVGESSTELCAQPACDLCCVLRSGFGVIQNGVSGGRLSLYMVSSKATADAKNVGDVDTSMVKVLMSCRVVVGRPFDTPNPDKFQMIPPGYDSLYRKPKTVRQAKTSSREFVVYDPAAISVAYLFVVAKPSAGVPSEWSSS